MEFDVKTELSVIPEIAFNSEQLKQEVVEKMEHYNNLVFSADDVSGARDERAKLNKLTAAVDKKRKEVKADINKPYEIFEKQLAEILAPVKNAIESIDKQIKDFEQAEADKKLVELKAFYNEIIGEFANLIPLEKILPEKWANKTYTVKKIKEDMQKKVTEVKNDWKIIKVSCKPYVTECLNAYLDALNISDALAKKNILEALTKEIGVSPTEMLTEATESAEAVNYPQTENVPQNADLGHSETPNNGKLYTIKFCVTHSLEKLKALKEFLNIGGYKYE